MCGSTQGMNTDAKGYWRGKWISLSVLLLLKISHPGICGLHIFDISCKKTVLGSSYRGTETTTKDGIACQRWQDQTPHTHTFTASDLKVASLPVAKNYCRNPDGETDGPWCYTTDENKRWQYCTVPLCSDLAMPNSQVYIDGNTSTCKNLPSMTGFLVDVSQPVDAVLTGVGLNCPEDTTVAMPYQQLAPLYEESKLACLIYSPCTLVHASNCTFRCYNKLPNSDGIVVSHSRGRASLCEIDFYYP